MEAREAFKPVLDSLVSSLRSATTKFTEEDYALFIELSSTASERFILFATTGDVEHEEEMNIAMDGLKDLLLSAELDAQAIVRNIIRSAVHEFFQVSLAALLD